MLDMRPNCKNCDRDLPATNTQAYICSFECTFCAPCTLDIFKNICPNCGGALHLRPTQLGKLWRGFPHQQSGFINLNLNIAALCAGP